MAGNGSIEDMHKNQQMTGSSNEEYVVRGAEISCDCGVSTCPMQLPKDHGVRAFDNRYLITHTDTKADNVSGFGTCLLDGKACKPDFKEWSKNDNNMRIYNNDTKNIEFAVERTANGYCSKGGKISFWTSGQTSRYFDSTIEEGAVQIKEDVIGIWQRDNKDFLGHIKVTYSGLYNFGFYSHNNTGESGFGTIFLYEKRGATGVTGALSYIGAYEIKYQRVRKKRH